MLHEFLAANAAELARRCRAKVVARRAPEPAPEDDHGIVVFIQQLIAMLRSEQSEPSAHDAALPGQLGEAAGRHGLALLRAGYTVGELVHDYGDLCQALTELAHEQQAQISVEEFHTFNRCLDNAIADSVTAFARVRDRKVADVGTATLNERLGSLAHELRNQLNTATLAFSAIRTGAVALSGATAGLVELGLSGARDLIDRALADVRLTAGLPSLDGPVSVNEVVEQSALSVALVAVARNLRFSTVVEPDLVVHADRQMLASAVSNLLQNAVKFTRAPGHITLRAHHAGDRVIIDIADECGGLPPGLPELLFQPFAQAGSDRTGLGLGLSISRRGIEASGGTLSVRDIPGTGCVFTIDLPRETN